MMIGITIKIRIIVTLGQIKNIIIVELMLQIMIDKQMVTKIKNMVIITKIIIIKEIIIIKATTILDTMHSILLEIVIQVIVSKTIL